MNLNFLTRICVTSEACEDGDVRLSGGRHYREGRVEVCRNQQWGRAVMMNGMKMMLLLCAGNWDFQKKVY